MVFYRLFFKRSAEKELRKIPNPYLAKIMARIHSLSHNRRPAGIQMLKGENRHFRLRQGDYRVIYEINEESREVTVIKIGHRREVYD